MTRALAFVGLLDLLHATYVSPAHLSEKTHPLYCLFQAWDNKAGWTADPALGPAVAKAGCWFSLIPGGVAKEACFDNMVLPQCLRVEMWIEATTTTGPQGTLRRFAPKAPAGHDGVE